MTLTQFEFTFNQYYRQICARVSLIVNDKDLAEDLVQDAFVKFWENKPLLLNQNSAPGYIAQMAVNGALMYLRKKQREEKEKSEFIVTRQKTINQTDDNLK